MNLRAVLSLPVNLIIQDDIDSGNRYIELQVYTSDDPMPQMHKGDHLVRLLFCPDEEEYKMLLHAALEVLGNKQKHTQ